MALFSDLDWIILLGVGAFLLLGKENGAVLRQFGRYYGRLVRMKQELVSDFAKAADLPPPGARSMTIRSALVQLTEPAAGRVSGIPVAVMRPPAPLVASGIFTGADGSAIGPGTWTVVTTGSPIEEGPR